MLHHILGSNEKLVFYFVTFQGNEFWLISSHFFTVWYTLINAISLPGLQGLDMHFHASWIQHCIPLTIICIPLTINHHSIIIDAGNMINQLPFHVSKDLEHDKIIWEQ
jgi:hypothetical protein